MYMVGPYQYMYNVHEYITCIYIHVNTCTLYVCTKLKTQAFSMNSYVYKYLEVQWGKFNYCVGDILYME